VAHVVVLAQVEHLADLGGTLGAALARLLLVRQPRQLRLALLHNHQVEHRQVLGHDAAAHALAAALAVAAPVAAEALVAGAHQHLAAAGRVRADA
jgi:hypothetical protein